MIIITPSVKLPTTGPGGDPGAARPPASAIPAVVPVSPVARPAAPGIGAGQVVTAKVLRGGDPGSTVLLEVAGKPVEARTTLSLSAGQQLNLSVRKTGAETVLQLVPAKPSAQATIDAGLRVALPRAGSLVSLLETLSALTATPAAGRDANLPASVQMAAREVLTAVPERQSLGLADNLRRALLDSGQFMESRAARQPVGSSLPGTDLKATLLRLANVIREQLATPARRGAQPSNAQSAEPGARQALPELTALGKASEGAIYRIQSQQLQHASGHAEQTGLLALEVPVRSERELEMLRLRVHRDGRRSDDAESAAWQVVIDLDLGASGSLQAHLTLRAGDISATLRMSDPDTARTTRDRLGELEARLEQAGLTVGSVCCLNAMPLEPAADERAPLLEVTV